MAVIFRKGYVSTIERCGLGEKWGRAYISLQTEVSINAYVAHANRDVFGEDADSFRPERWLQDQESLNRMDNYFLTVRPSPPVSIPYQAAATLSSLPPLRSILLTDTNIFFQYLN